MPRRTLFVAALVTAMFGLAVSSQAGVSKGGKVVAWATGSGHHTSGGKFQTFTFSARQYEDGTDKGQAQLRGRDATKTVAHVRVTCLNVVGNVAYMAGVVKKVKPQVTPNQVNGANVSFTVQDNGPTGDMVSALTFAGVGPAPTCTTGTAATLAVDRGQVKVRTRTP
jgi:hypothetical protein